MCYTFRYAEVGLLGGGGIIVQCGSLKGQRQTFRTMPWHMIYRRISAINASVLDTVVHMTDLYNQCDGSAFGQNRAIVLLVNEPSMPATYQNGPAVPDE